MHWILVRESNDGRTWRTVYSGPLTVSSEHHAERVNAKARPYVVVDRWQNDGYGWVNLGRERNYTPRYA